MEAADRSMDDLCDALMVEEILPRLSPKSLICLGCVSRRYNAMVTDPDFSARYWLRAGVFIQPLAHSGREPRPLFLSSSGGVLCSPATSAESMFGADLAFLPAPSAREKAYLRPFGASYCIRSTDVVMHSAAGLLLAAWMALPELPCPPAEWQSGLLRVDTDGDAAKKPNKFQVLLFNHPFQWRKPGGCFDLRLFSSDTGQWKTIQLHPPIHVADGLPDWTPIGQSGRAYCIVRIEFHDHAILYSSDEHSVDVIRLPTGIGTSVWKHCCCIGERHGGGLRYALSNDSVFEVWDLQTKGGDSMWMLAHRVGIAQLLERNPEVACGRPLGFHPTDDGVVFLGIPGAVAAYSIQNGTMSLHHLTHDCYLRSRDMFPYVHPPYLVQIPAIKNSILASHEQ
ncbi:hypothetical protein HU200_036312 [Digitaria exilis]|uniref:F-box protein At3g26010-like beta-propeller domain-containing protein n=1 Tax=Digitaria exilis TaxID=1010633 RepID=A0A835EK44_9POAL|nr:hypothetical protein HU200_036312 [Digitaria exilis]